MKRIGATLLLLVVITYLHAANITWAESLESRIKPLVQAHHGKVSVAIKHLVSGESFRYNADQVMPTASLIKFPIMVEAYRQQHARMIDLKEMVTLRDEDKVPGSGVLTEHFSDGMQLSLRDAIRVMIVYSDNTATNLVIRSIGLPNVAASMEKMGLEETKLHAQVFRRETSIFPDRSQQFGLGTTTANETIQLYELLYKRQLVSSEASEAMLDHLLNCNDNTKLAATLPTGVRIAHKGGAVSQARCDAGIIFSPNGPLTICVLTSDNEDRSWQPDNEAQVLCAAIAREAMDHFSPATAATKATAKELRIGSFGLLVESLQRTLNSRLEPSLRLGVDGDFGPATEMAVVRFQREHQLEANGIVGQETWKALGPLQTQDAPVPDPQVINAMKLPRAVADPLTGLPFVTCEAWAIADASTGKMLWGNNANRVLDIASTTKIMTAYVVLKLAQANPTVLDEQVTFSTRADNTPGSTSGVRSGEQLSVRELLFGLLLPSGNDASIALAEHFGDRFEGDANTSKSDDSLVLFVNEMNRTASRLQLQQTTYKNPHGLTADGHESTAEDLIKLAHSAMKLSTFRGYVATRQRGCTLIGPGGYRRNVLWKNTNRLLRTEGHGGIKTGTTRAAGACLVSHGTRGEDALLMVILGAKSGDARYTDARNLYRWAWSELGHKGTE
jgi:serine-type D-Ala-D-Ala carboxypeptidase (penicillin-binding protein 5/6)